MKLTSYNLGAPPPARRSKSGIGDNRDLAEESTTAGALYRCHGLSLFSEIPLPLPPATADEAPEWRISRAPGAASDETAIQWVEPDPEDASPLWLITGHSPKGIHLDFPKYARFLIQPDARKILAKPRPGVPERTLGHLLMNQVVPLAMANQGYLMLHASAVETPCGAVAFLGPSGAGKTTFATALALRGRRLVTEDIVRFELKPGSALCHPCPSPPRLWSDSFDSLLPGERESAEAVAHYTSKLRMSVEQADAIRFVERPVPLGALIVLDSADGRQSGAPIELKPPAPREAFEKATTAFLRIKPHSKDQIRREFDWATSLARLAPFYSLRFPRDYASLPAVIELLEERFVTGASPQ